MLRRFLDAFRPAENDGRQSQVEGYPHEGRTNTDDTLLSSSGALLASTGLTDDHSVKINCESTVPSTHSSPRNSRKRQQLQRSQKLDVVSVDQATMMTENMTTKTDFCLREEGPLYILQLATKGQFLELERRILSDRSELLVRDKEGKDLVHYAVRHGHIPTLDFLISQGADINSQDFVGNTPLHTAIESSQKLSLEYLLVHEANPSMQNERHMAPIHLAVELNNTQMLQALLNHDSVDSNLTGENGATALHYAAWKDHPDCALLLLKHGAKLCVTCDIGMSPMHLAAQNSSSATLEVLIKIAEQRGCGARAELLAKVNQEKNTPLHAAISGGNIEIVKTCLRAGAHIDAKQENSSTPVHLASAQGALDMIKLMFEMQPYKKMTCLEAKDNMGLTPLHMAAMLDRTPTVEYLIEEGAEIDSRAGDGQTPLLLAASKGAWSSTLLLIKSEADVNIRDSEQRNILHLIIRGGGQPSHFECTIEKTVLAKLLNEPDQYGCTPLHYASKQGQMTTIDKLLQLGAHLNAKNNKKQSALHFAARYGRYNTCRRLISSVYGTNIVNEPDGSGQTALHAAAASGHAQVVRYLLQSGAGIFKDVNGNTALHLAAMNGYTQTMSAILNVNSHLLDSVNKSKDTCLHLATVAGHANVVTLLLDMGAKILLNKDLLHFLDLGTKHGKKDVCVAIISHDRWKEALDMRSTLYGCPMVGMIQYMPEVCQMILDRCRIPSGPDPKDKDFHYTYDFQYMQVDVERLRKMRKNGIDILPMFALNMMVKFNRVECLSHPVCEGFLAMKWCTYGMWFHMLNLIVYFAYVCCLTGFVVTYDFCSSTAKTPTNSTLLPDDNSTAVDDHTNIEETKHKCERQSYVELRTEQKFLVIIILLFVVVNMIKEIMQMIQQKWKYVKDPNNRVEWILYISTAIFIGPFLANSNRDYQWQFGAIAIYLAWFNYLLFFQRFSTTGIYVVMFLEILRTVLHVIKIFSVLVVAFGLAFFVILNTGDSAGFSTPPLSIISTVIMMLGNIDYRDVWVIPLSSAELPNAPMAFFMLLIFILLMPILLINLLIGLAVGDIEAIQKNACLKRIAMQVQLHTDLEQKLPSRLLKLVDQPFLKVYPNRCCTPWETLKNRVLMIKKVGEKTNGLVQDETMEYNSFLYSELNKQKMRMKQMAYDMKKQHELLRLIVQKMEIHTEADDVDEDLSAMAIPAQTVKERANEIGWSSAALRHVILKQALIVSKWKKSETD